MRECVPFHLNPEEVFVLWRKRIITCEVRSAVGEHPPLRSSIFERGECFQKVLHHFIDALSKLHAREKWHTFWVWTPASGALLHGLQVQSAFLKKISNYYKRTKDRFEKNAKKHTHIRNKKNTYTFCLENLNFGVMCVRVGVSFCASVFLCCFCCCCDNTVWAGDDIGLTFDTNTPKLTRRWRRSILCYHWQQCSVCLFVRLCQCLRLKLSIKRSIACILKAENEDKFVR